MPNRNLFGGNVSWSNIIFKVLEEYKFRFRNIIRPGWWLKVKSVKSKNTNSLNTNRMHSVPGTCLHRLITCLYLSNFGQVFNAST